jgi:hypothetical protein
LVATDADPLVGGPLVVAWNWTSLSLVQLDQGDRRGGDIEAEHRFLPWEVKFP